MPLLSTRALFTGELHRNPALPRARQHSRERCGRSWRS
jgi:hypothetical protein